MKIGFSGIELPEGKTKYKDEKLEALAAKDKPKKVSPYFAEFIHDEFVRCDAIAVASGAVLDVLIHDMDSLESRLSRATDAERPVLEKCLEQLEEEIPLCDVEFTDEEAQILAPMAPCSMKPIAQVDPGADVNKVIQVTLAKARQMFFYTSGPQESHAWLVPQETDIVSCAGKIHSDLARGFIKGDVVSFEDYMDCHNFNDCKSKGVARLEDRDYIVQPDEVIEIRFSV
jgi:hypothetical protein